MNDEKSFTRREVIVGAVAAGVAACGRSELYEYSEDGGVAASAPEDDEVTPDNAAYKHFDYFPLHLTATTTLASNSGGGVNAISLQNPLGTPMEILEIKWQFVCDNPVITGGMVGCKLELGKIPLTNGFVPVWSFGRALNVDFGEYQRQTTVKVDNEYSWKLAHPLYIPAGATLTPIFVHKGYVQEDVTVRISYSARSLPAGYKPKNAHVPWVASYESKVFDKLGVADTDRSNETELVNPLNVPVTVQHFIGRVASFDRADPTALAIDDSDIGSTLLTLTAYDSRGEPVVPNPALFHSVFPLTTRAWSTDVVIPPKSFFIFSLNKAAPAAESATAMQSQAFISFVGWREVKGGM